MALVNVRRSIRGWHDLRGKWLNKKGANEKGLISIIEGEKSRVRNRFGDPHFLGGLQSRNTKDDGDAC